jgi:tight adherence protein C
VRGFLGRRAKEKAPQLPAPPDRLAPDLAAMLPATSDTRRQLQQLLWTAGYYRPSALTEYLAIRAVLCLGVVAATTLIALLAPVQDLPVVLLAGFVLAGLGFSLPRVILSAQASARASRLTRGLPLAMDVIGLCLTAGQNLIRSLEQTSRELAKSCPDLSLELQIVQQQASMHSLEQALLQWAERLDIAEIRSLALLLVQSDRLGTDMVNTLLEVADSQRIVQKQKVEAQANRANFWMLFPTLFCLWTASAIILVGPVYLEFWEYRREQMSTLIRGARGQVERSTTNTTTPTAPATETTSPGSTGP